MKKMTWPLIAAAAVIIVGLLMLISWIAEPPAGDPGPGPRVAESMVKANIKGNLDEIACAFAKDAGAVGNFQQSWMFWGDGADKAIVGTGTLAHIFDHGSPRTTDSHDRLILAEEPPSEIKAERHGSALLLCDKQRLGIVIVRQYCINSASSPPWNNEIEEIAFPKYAEVWLSDELYAGLADPSAFTPSPELIQGLRKAYSGFVIKETWKARRFSDVLPGSEQATTDCRKDFDGVEKFD